jgi:hypothetical protein
MAIKNGNYRESDNIGQKSKKKLKRIATQTPPKNARVIPCGPANHYTGTYY